MKREDAVEHYKAVLVSKKRIQDGRYKVNKVEEFINRDIEATEILISTVELVLEVIELMEDDIETNDVIIEDRRQNPELSKPDFWEGANEATKKYYRLLTGTEIDKTPRR